MRHDEWLIKENISELRQLMSDQNLQLLPDYGQRMNVLKELGFVDENERVELKGKVACEVSIIVTLPLSLLFLLKHLPPSDPFSRRTRPHGAYTRERPLTIHTRRNSLPPLLLRISRKDRRNTHAHTGPRARSESNHRHLRARQPRANSTPSHYGIFR